jgi:endonuclease/exonuclease/phosphatase family metal-dependent hydrolase
MSDDRAFWVENLCKYKTLVQLKQSEFFSSHGSQIESYLKTPQVQLLPHIVSRLNSFIRIVQWNIEKGKRFKEILARLQTDEILKWADVIVLNEADFGMIRSENRHVARDLAEALGMHMAFGPVYFELTKGVDEEQRLEGENREGMQGNAILSRFPIIDSCTVPLPVSFEPYEFHEKRFGQRSCLWAKLQLQKKSIWVGSVHLELRNKPRDRAIQMRKIMEHLPDGDNDAYVLCGDLNTNSFGRGSSLQTVKSIMRLLLSPADKIKKMLLSPELGSEPLFRILKCHGFNWEGLNSNQETARTALDSLEEADFLPAALMNLVKKRLVPFNGYLCFKLDWILGKNVFGIGSEKYDSGAQVQALKPAAVKTIHFGPDRISDHLPIYADIDLPGIAGVPPALF